MVSAAGRKIKKLRRNWSMKKNDLSKGLSKIRRSSQSSIFYREESSQSSIFYTEESSQSSNFYREESSQSSIFYREESSQSSNSYGEESRCPASFNSGNLISLLLENIISFFFKKLNGVKKKERNFEDNLF